MDIKQAFGSCPRCGTGVDYREDITVCNNCGWMPEKAESRRSYNKSLAILCVVSAIAFVHTINWGGYAFEIISLKAKTTFGIASLEDLDRTAEVCEDQLKYDCAADALNEKAWKTNNASDFKLLGDLYRRMSQWSEAIEAYESALAKLQDDKNSRSVKGDAYYGLAKSFHETGELAMAEGYYKKALRAKPGVLQVTVTSDYAKMLKSAGRVKDARRVIASAERKSGAKGRFDHLVDL